ncbi:MAG: hypothetical protein HY426_05005 [Candidatus Levybacteria bacterium]|nr:hypothetical protein [Candidatus Levybacteria bacterium]
MSEERERPELAVIEGGTKLPSGLVVKEVPNLDLYDLFKLPRPDSYQEPARTDLRIVPDLTADQLTEGENTSDS